MSSDLEIVAKHMPVSVSLARIDLSGTTLKALADVVAFEATRMFGARRASLWLYRPSLHKLVLAGGVDPPVVPLPPEQGFPDTALVWPATSSVTVEALLTESFGAAPDHDGGVIALPLRSSDRPQGVLLLEFPTERQTRAALESLDTEAFADQVSAALANLRSLESAHRHERELQALYETAGELSSQLDLEFVLQAIVGRSRALVGTDVSYITLLDEGTQSIFMRVTSGVRHRSFEDIRLSLGEGLGGLVAKEWRAIYTSDYLNDARFHHRQEVDDEVRKEGIKSILGVPMRVAGKTIGVLYVANRRVTSFADADVSLLSSLADHAAVAIENARLFEQLAQTAAQLTEANELVRTQLSRLEQTDAAHRELTELVLAGEGLQAIVRVLFRLTGEPVTLIDDSLRLLAFAGDPVDSLDRTLRRDRRVPPACLEDRSVATAVAAGEGLRTVQVHPARPRDARPRLLTPVVAKGEVLGHLLTPSPTREGEIEVILEQGARVLALEMLKDRSIAEIQERIRGEFLDDLLADRPPPMDVLRKRSAQVGFEIEILHHLILFEVDEENREGRRPGTPRARQALLGMVRETPEVTFAAERRDRVVAFIPANDGPEGRSSRCVEVVEAVRARFEREEWGMSATAALTDACRSAPDYRRQFSLAGKALRVFRELGRNRLVIEVGRLGLLPLVFEERNRSEIEQAIDRIVGPLIRYDAENGTELVTTLEAYFLSVGSVARTAERCHIHLNSVYYRLQRIRELLGRDLDDPEISLDLQVALRARRLLLSED